MCSANVSIFFVRVCLLEQRKRMYRFLFTSLTLIKMHQLSPTHFQKKQPDQREKRTHILSHNIYIYNIYPSILGLSVTHSGWHVFNKHSPHVQQPAHNFQLNAKLMGVRSRGSWGCLAFRNYTINYRHKRKLTQRRLPGSHRRRRA